MLLIRFLNQSFLFRDVSHLCPSLIVIMRKLKIQRLTTWISVHIVVVFFLLKWITREFLSVKVSCPYRPVNMHAWRPHCFRFLQFCWYCLLPVRWSLGAIPFSVCSSYLCDWFDSSAFYLPMWVSRSYHLRAVFALPFLLRSFPNTFLLNNPHHVLKRQRETATSAVRASALWPG